MVVLQYVETKPTKVGCARKRSTPSHLSAAQATTNARMYPEPIPSSALIVNQFHNLVKANVEGASTNHGCTVLPILNLI